MMLRHVLRRTLATTPLPLPALSPTMEVGRVVKWHKAVGDRIEVDDVLCEIETDKATVDFTSVEEGYLADILVEEGADEIAVGALIGAMVDSLDEKVDYAGAVVDKEDGVSAAPSAPVEGGGPPPMPSASFLMADHPDVDFSTIKGSGVRGRVRKGDVLDFLERGSAATSASPAATSVSPAATSVSPAASGATTISRSDRVEPMSQMRKVIASRLSASKLKASHFYVTSEHDVELLIKLRETLDFKVSMNDLIVKAVANALLENPCVNSNVSNKAEVSVAVATPQGLITPIVKNAHELTPSQISSKIRDLAGRAKTNSLELDEFQGGTFTVSNLGMFGIDEFTAVINTPQTSILAVGASPDGKTMRSTISCDANFVKVPEACKFLKDLSKQLSSPMKLF